MDSRFNQFIDQKYLSLETYKRDKTPIQTPVGLLLIKDNSILQQRKPQGRLSGFEIIKMHGLLSVL